MFERTWNSRKWYVHKASKEYQKITIAKFYHLIWFSRWFKETFLKIWFVTLVAVFKHKHPQMKFEIIDLSPSCTNLQLLCELKACIRAFTKGHTQVAQGMNMGLLLLSSTLIATQKWLDEKRDCLQTTVFCTKSPKIHQMSVNSSKLLTTSKSEKKSG